jgi:DNA topoisomerase-1
VHDRRIACIVRACQELPGQHLFEYRADDGCIHPIGSSEVNEYLKAISGQNISAKDFRTWAGTLLTAEAFSKFGGRPTTAGVRKVISRVASELGNTVAVCRKSYIHPAVIDAFLEGSFSLTGPRLDKKLIRFVERAVH